MICADCGHDNDPDASFCVECSQPLLVSCPNCGIKNQPSAKFCKKCGSSLIDFGPEVNLAHLENLHSLAPDDLLKKMRAAQPDIKGQRKPVTIFFADIVGSTAIAETLDPEMWKEVVSGAHRRVSTAVYRYEGTIAQLLGDGVLAFFGAPLTHEDDPERAVRAALDLQDSLSQYRSELAGLVDEFSMRIGIHLGEVVVGDMGTDEHREYLAVGDVVNVAARLEGAAQPGQILVSEDCARLVAHTIEMEEPRLIQVKGKSSPVQAAVVIGLKASPGPVRGLTGAQTHFVGRAQEITTVENALRTLQEGHGQILFITGEAGIGKTRLLEEARLRVFEEASSDQAGAASLHWLEGRALSYGSSLSFWPITQILLNDLGLTESSPEVMAIVALRKRVGELFKEDQASRALAYLAHLLNLHLDSEQAKRIKQMDGEAVKHQTLNILSKYVALLAERNPTVLALEDLHWSDASSLEVLEQLLTLTDHCPLMLVFLMRIDREHGSWTLKTTADRKVPHRLTEIELRRLDETDANDLIRRMLGHGSLAHQLSNHLISRTGGNPFYLEEVLHHLIDQELIIEQEGNWQLNGSIEEVGIPDTLQGVLMARIDHLEQDVRKTLQIAAVIGKSFLFKILQAITKAENRLETHLSQLQRVDLVRELTRLPELEYAFKHSLTQEVAYNSLLVQRRLEFHLKIAEALVELFPDRQEELLGVIAHHFDKGGATEKASTHLIHHGDKLRIGDAHDEAIDAYLRALPLLEELSDDEEIRLTWLKVAMIHHVNSRFEESSIAYERARGIERIIREQLSTVDQSSPSSMQVPATPKLLETLDPGKASLSWNHVSQLFRGLVVDDLRMNIEPMLAESWEISSDGTTYTFHLREDATWSDGQPITAHDVEWTWIRNLSLGNESPYLNLMDDIKGARELRLGLESDPTTIGVKALDSLTLQVDLARPVPYFLYIMSSVCSFPLPRHVIEEHGDEWWKPRTFVGSGPFNLVEWNDARVRFARNDSYSGTFPGNLGEIVFPLLDDSSSKDFRQNVTRAYQSDDLDALFDPANNWDRAHNFPIEDLIEYEYIAIWFLFLNCSLPPMDHIDLRKAIAHGIDHHTGSERLGPANRATGGLVNPGYPGYSEGLAYSTDEEMARSLLQSVQQEVSTLELSFGTEYYEELFSIILSPLEERLGIVLKHVDLNKHPSEPVHIQCHGWGADYPDPDTFLRTSCLNRSLDAIGYQHPKLDKLLSNATSTLDRKERISYYRQIDEFFVREEILAIPLWYELTEKGLLKPHIKNFDPRFTRLENVVVEDADRKRIAGE